MGFEPMMRVLQTLALPLGHVALQITIAGSILTDTPQLDKLNSDLKCSTTATLWRLCCIFLI